MQQVCATWEAPYVVCVYCVAQTNVCASTLRYLEVAVEKIAFFLGGGVLNNHKPTLMVAITLTRGYTFVYGPRTNSPLPRRTRQYHPPRDIPPAGASRSVRTVDRRIAQLAGDSRLDPGIPPARDGCGWTRDPRAQRQRGSLSAGLRIAQSDPGVRKVRMLSRGGDPRATEVGVTSFFSHI